MVESKGRKGKSPRIDLGYERNNFYEYGDINQRWQQEWENNNEKDEKMGGTQEEQQEPSNRGS